MFVSVVQSFVAPDQEIGSITIFLSSSQICAALPAISAGRATSTVRYLQFGP